MTESPTPRPSMVLAAYSEPIVDGRRVIVFGDSSSGLAEHLLERGARLVHIYDPDAMRVAEAATRNTSRNVAYGPLAEGALAVRDGAFDVGIVENLALIDDAASALKRLRRALSPRGVALVALPNPDVQVRLLPGGPSGELDYYRLYDLVAASFEHVRMLGQTPFVGYAVADFGAGGVPEPSLDSAFVPGGAEEPEWFVALASSMGVHLDEFAVVQLPFRLALPNAQSRESEAELARARAAERRARDRMAALEAELAALRDKAQSRADADADRTQIAELKRQLEQRDRWTQELEARLTIADARADDAAAELEEHRERASRAAEPRSGRQDPSADSPRQLQALEKELAALRHELDAMIAERDAARRERTDAVAQLEAFSTEIDARRAEALELRQTLADRDSRIAELTTAEDDGAELAALEAQLRERGVELRRREKELAEAERLGRELLLELEAARQSPGGGDTGELTAKLDRLAEVNAQREADLAAARWSIEALESRLVDAEGADQRLELERALDQAKTRLQEQAVLIEQLRAASRS